MFAYYFFRVALIAVLALLLVRPAAADTIPATETMTNRYCLPLNNWCASSTNYVSRRFTKSEVCAWLNGSGWGASDFSLVDTGGTYGYGVCDSATPGNTDPAINISTPAIVYSCPVNYTLDGGGTTCTSNPPLCPAAGTLHSDGFFNIGTSPYGTLLNSACVSGCTINLISGASPAATQVLDGVKHYFGQAKYEHTGASCSPDTPNFLSDFVGSLPSTTCAAGQQMITMSGVTKCFDSQGAEVNVNSASAVAAVVAQGDAAYAAMMADTAARMTAMGGTASDVVAAQTIAAGVYAAGGNTSGGTASGADPVMTAFCEQNPTASICADQDFGSVGDVTLGDKTVNVSITPVAVGGAGSCPAPSPMVLRGQTYYFVWDTYCQFASGIKPILLAFAWLAAAGILVGGFRS